MNRSIETVRYTLKQFDKEHPEQAVFPEQTGILTDDVKKKIYQQSRRGESVDSLARRFCRTRTTIYRVLNEMRARRILELPLDYMHHESFDQASNRKGDSGSDAGGRGRAKKVRGPSGLPPYLAALYEVPLLTREQEGHLFRKFNYLKHKATKLRQKLDPSQARTSLMNEIEKLYDEAVKIKNEIVQANLRLVVSIAKRHVSGVGGLLRPGERRQHVADPSRGEVRLLARQQVQHVCELGDHEELCPDHSGGVQAARSLPHEPGRAVHDEAGRAERRDRPGNGPADCASSRSSGFCRGWTSASGRLLSAGLGWTTAGSR